MPKTTKHVRTSAKVAELRRRLEEAEEVLLAIKGGQVDALVVTGPLGDQIYTLKDATRTYQAVVEEMNEATLTLSNRGIILHANRRLTEILGIPLEQVLGEPFSRYVVPAYKAAAERLFKVGLADRSKGELALTGAGSAMVPVDVSLRRVVLDDVPRVAAVVSDISERKRAEEQMRRYAAELEQRVQERTAQLQGANQKLEHLLSAERTARTELEATNKELEAFAYSVSHDLRGPLNQIDEFAKMVLDDYGPQLPEPGQHILQLIHENAAAMNCLAEDLLTLTRMSQQPLRKKTVSMRELVGQVLDDFRSAQAGRQVEIHVGELPEAAADPILVKQVWVNLIGNAFKFTAPMPVARIEIGSQTNAPPKSQRQKPAHGVALKATGRIKEDRIAYFVKDNGVGFDMAHSDRLFRAFQRLHHPEDFEGSGLGLAIVERVVRRHGGQVWAESKVDQGTTIYFTLGDI